MRRLGLLLCCCWVFLIGCSGQPATLDAITTPDVTETPPPQDATPSATLAGSPEPQIATLVIWVPERLLPTENEPAMTLFNEQLAAFAASEPNIQIEIRRKRSQDIGGILSTLRTASAVAPGALPDITLLRYNDLLIAEQNDLIQPLEGRIASGILSNINDNALKLGFIEEKLYGLPYMLDVLLTATTTNEHTSVYWKFDTLLQNKLTFAFPVVRSNGVNETFFLQYLAAGGTPPQDGQLTINETALLTVLRFYEAAYQAGLVDAETANYVSSNDYAAALLNGSIDAGVINASNFLQLRPTTGNKRPTVALLPTHDGRPITLINGWMWVMVTNDADHQVVAGRLINWMMAANRQGAYAQVAGMLPTHLDAMHNYPVLPLESAVLDDLLANAHIPFIETSNTAAQRAMQNALISVLKGERTAEEATESVLNQLAD